MRILTLVVSLVIAFSFNASAQKKDIDGLYYWKVLQDVNYRSNFDKETGEILYEPVFGKKVLKLDGKKIFLKGYIIPADMSGGKMTLSAFPYSSCYFCGGAGPETVIEVDADGPIIYRMDKPIELEGVLKLNTEDPLRLIYILEEATYHRDK